MVSMEMSQTEIRLVDHDRSLPRLRSTMNRVGASMPPQDFIYVVSNAYHEVEAQRHAIDMHAYFRSSGGYRALKQALMAAKESFDQPVSILNIGCGAGYDLEVLREVFSPADVRKIVCCDISVDMQTIARKQARGYPCRFVLGHAEEALVYGSYDLVITNAMIHHVADLEAFFGVLERNVRPGGGFVMGHEPNARYWRNPECMAVLNKLRAARRRRRNTSKLLKPSRYFYKLAQVLGVAGEETLETRINRILREHAGFTGDLTLQEIHRLVDVHVPNGADEEFKIGLDGFDWEELQRGLLSSFQLAWVESSGYMGETCSPSALPRRWREINDRLAAKYPLDGSNFSAFWRRRAGG
jgi:SAM-dependent methyltransferase